jgi:maltose alpha-D-glucosyltransferase/alpha-amylase
MMTEIFLLRKSIYELGDKLNNRPDWVKIPLQGILDLINEPTAAATATKESTTKEAK